jgi:hypothetical protein
MTAFADDNKWYVGGGVGFGRRSSSASKFEGGYQILKAEDNGGLAIEAGHANLGNPTYTESGVNLSSAYSASYLDAVVIMPIYARWHLLVKLGVDSTSLTGVAPSFRGHQNLGLPSAQA